MKNLRSEKGLTLIEVMMAAVIVAVMAGAVYAAFAQGIRVWRRAVEEKPELKMDLFFDKIQSDLRNVFSCKSGDFAGAETTVQFFTVVIGLPAKIRYYYDPGTASVYRDRVPYEKVLYPKSDASEELLRPVLDHIQGLRFEYYERNKDNKYIWKQKWSRDCFPRAVKIFIDYGETKPKTVSRIVSIPAAQGCLA